MAAETSSPSTRILKKTADRDDRVRPDGIGHRHARRSDLVSQGHDCRYLINLAITGYLTSITGGDLPLGNKLSKINDALLEARSLVVEIGKRDLIVPF
uniref:hypothetical protein n=1 Tax=uncultured Sphingomonas sp. TaxID=158754 RepID=UPI0035CAA71A